MSEHGEAADPEGEIKRLRERVAALEAALEASEARARGIYETLQTRLVVHDTDGLVTDIFDPSGDEFMSRERWVGASIHDRFPPRLASAIQTLIDDARQSDSPIVADVTMEHPNHPRGLSLRLRALSSGGQVYVSAIANTPITSREEPIPERQLELLRLENVRLREGARREGLMHTIGRYFIDHELEQAITLALGALRDTFTSDVAWMITPHEGEARLRVVDDDGERDGALVGELPQIRRPVSVESATHDAEGWGARLGAESLILLPLWQQDRLLAILGLGMRTTPRQWSGSESAALALFGELVTVGMLRQLAEAEKRRQEEIFRVIFDAAPLALVYIDREERYRLLNEKMRSTIGLPMEQILGRTLRELVPPAAYEATEQYTRASLDEGRASTFTVFSPDPQEEGGQRVYHTMNVPHLDREGRVLGGATILVDITERVRAEQSRQL